MFSSLIKKFIGSKNERELKKMWPIVEKINTLEASISALSDEQLTNKTLEFKERHAKGESLDSLLPEAFAVCREASKRVLGMRHFDVQLIGGMVLHAGKIAEMKTGEGKTLVATLPAYLNAISGKGVHVVTVNDYLAKRDSEWMGRLYNFLGLTVGIVVHGIEDDQRRLNYADDITYGTNNEFGFDYLRDNMKFDLEDYVQRGFNYAIVDEVDSILIDEARTPLIISGPTEDSTDKYYVINAIIPKLEKGEVTDVEANTLSGKRKQYTGDYTVDEKAKSAALTEQGVLKVEKLLKIDNLYDPRNIEILHHVNQALRAHAMYKLDVDYVVKDGEVLIVDEFTGRLMPGRRWSDGLHQAIEAKEGVKIENENQTLATITFQNYFRMYSKLSGMTGTADTEAEEFHKIYKLDVCVIPTNRPLVRPDAPDVIYKTEMEKFKAVIEDIKEHYAVGQPCLVGTISIEKSEVLSELLKRQGVPHNVLNAKQHEREAEIVAQAGRLGTVTIATNMAGRGTDIILGGNPEFMAKQDLRKQGFSEDLIDASTAHNETDDEIILDVRRRFSELYEQFRKQTGAEHEKVVATGGLCIMGTERHESRRIDNQLRGRSGRQGDPGRSQFFLSLEDDLMRLFGGEKMTTVFAALGVEEDLQIENQMLSNAIETAQKRVESRNFSIRKHVLEYDDVMNKQREVIYGQRRMVLEGADLRENYRRMITDLMRETLLDFCADIPDSANWDTVAIDARIRDLFGPLDTLKRLADAKKGIEPEEFTQQLTEEALAHYEARESEVGSPDVMREIERVILLRTVDAKWMDHIDAMDDLRDSIGMRSYAQHDPVVEYKKEGFTMFEAMNKAIQEDSVRLIMRARFNTDKVIERKSIARNMTEGHGGSGFSGSEQESAAPAPAKSSGKQALAATGSIASTSEPVRQPAKRDMAKVGRNDPCPCGSGRKYKNCHGKNES